VLYPGPREKLFGQSNLPVNMQTANICSNAPSAPRKAPNSYPNSNLPQSVNGLSGLDALAFAASTRPQLAENVVGGNSVVPHLQFSIKLIDGKKVLVLRQPLSVITNNK